MSKDRQVSKTEDKLDEARYFLERMEATCAERRAFKCNLSAFLTAARSVRDVMYREFRDVLGFKNWWDSKLEWKPLQENEQTDDPIRDLNSFFHQSRNLTVHQRGVQPRGEIDVGANETVSVGAGNFIHTEFDADGSEIKPGTVRSKPSSGSALENIPAREETAVEWNWHFASIPESAGTSDVVTLCSRYLERLGRFVSECKAQFER